MRLLSSLLLALIFLSGISDIALAQEVQPNPHLKDLAWMAGVWAAEIKPTGGKPLRIETTFRWARHKQALNFNVVFRGEGEPVAQYEGVYFYHPGAKELRMLQTSRQGNVTESVVTFAADGKMLQENKAYAADGALQLQRVEVTRDGEKRFQFKAAVKQGDAWTDAVAITYERTNAPP